MHFQFIPNAPVSHGQLSADGVYDEKTAHVRDLTSNLHDDDIALAYNAASNRSRSTSSPDDGGETGPKTIVSDAMRRVACGCTGRRSPIFHVHAR